MYINLVVATDRKGLIGKGNSLPWHLPEDLRRFKNITLGKTLVMGRKTYESILRKNGKPLSDRKSVVLSRRSARIASISTLDNYTVIFFDNVELLLRHFERKNEDLYVIGGAEIYKLFLPLADYIYWTETHDEFEGDVYFPKIDFSEWNEEWKEFYQADERNPHSMTFHLLRREK